MKYVLNPARTYWVDVIAQVEASQHLNFHELDKPVPLPPPYQFACYARLIVNVPAMYINHKVLAWELLRWRAATGAERGRATPRGGVARPAKPYFFTGCR